MSFFRRRLSHNCFERCKQLLSNASSAVRSTGTLCNHLISAHIRRAISWPGRDCPIVEFYRRNTRQARCFQGWRTAFKWHTTTRPPACLRAKIATTLIPMTMMIHQDPKPDQCQFLRCGQPRRRHLHLQLLAGRSLRHRRPQHQRQQHPAPPAPPPPKPAPAQQEEEPPAGPKACDDYRVDMAAARFGDCKCGFPKADHKKTTGLAPAGGGARKMFVPQATPPPAPKPAPAPVPTLASPPPAPPPPEPPTPAAPTPVAPTSAASLWSAKTPPPPPPAPGGSVSAPPPPAASAAAAPPRAASAAAAEACTCSAGRGAASQGQRRVMTTVSIWLRLASETASAVFRRRTTRRRPAWHRREAAP